MEGGGSECGIKAAVGALVGTRLDRQDLRLQRHEGRVVRTADLGVVLAGAVGAQGCVFLLLAVFVQAVRDVPVGSADQVTPVDIPVGVALDEGRGPAGIRGHAEARAAVGVAASVDCAVTMSEDTVSASAVPSNVDPKRLIAVILLGAFFRSCRRPKLPPRYRSVDVPCSFSTFLRAPNRVMGVPTKIRSHARADGVLTSVGASPSTTLKNVWYDEGVLFVSLYYDLPVYLNCRVNRRFKYRFGFRCFEQQTPRIAKHVFETW